LEPLWAALGPSLKGQVSVGTVDCDAQTELKSRFDIRGFPTLKMFVDGEEVTEYRGPRTLDALKQFAQSFTRPAVSAITADELKDVLASGNPENPAEFVAVIYVAQAAVPEYLRKFALKHIGSLEFLTASKSDARVGQMLKLQATGDHIAVIKDVGLISSFQVTDEAKTLEWLESHRLPLLTKLDQFNSNMMFKLQKYLVIGIVNPEKSINAELDVLKGAAIALEEKKVGDTVLVWLDGQEWLAYTQKTFGIDLDRMPAIVVISPDGDEYYTTGADGKPVVLIKERILEVLDDIKGGRVTPQHVKGVIGRLVKTLTGGDLFGSWSYFVLAGIIVLALLFYSRWNSAESAGYNTVKAD
jgi:hypothetical protein